MDVLTVDEKSEWVTTDADELVAVLKLFAADNKFRERLTQLGYSLWLDRASLEGVKWTCWGRGPCGSGGGSGVGLWSRLVVRVGVG